MAKATGQSFSELKRLSIHEFLMIYTQLIKDNK
jgi:hypothetical protein